MKYWNLATSPLKLWKVSRSQAQPARVGAATAAHHDIVSSLLTCQKTGRMRQTNNS